jgi:hypothetical protein
LEWGTGHAERHIGELPADLTTAAAFDRQEPASLARAAVAEPISPVVRLDARDFRGMEAKLAARPES